MKMKIFTFKVILVLLIGNINAQTFTVTKNSANKALMSYLENNNISNEKDKVFQTSQLKIGDLNNDKKPDAVVRYILGPKKGNVVTGSGIVVFINTGDSLKFVTNYQEEPNAVLKSIVNGIIFIEKLMYAQDDPRCCPSIKSKSGLMLIDNKLSEIN